MMCDQTKKISKHKYKEQKNGGRARLQTEPIWSERETWEENIITKTNKNDFLHKEHSTCKKSGT